MRIFHSFDYTPIIQATLKVVRSYYMHLPQCKYLQIKLPQASQTCKNKTNRNLYFQSLLILKHSSFLSKLFNTTKMFNNTRNVQYQNVAYHTAETFSVFPTQHKINFSNHPTFASQPLMHLH